MTGVNKDSFGRIAIKEHIYTQAHDKFKELNTNVLWYLVIIAVERIYTVPEKFEEESLEIKDQVDLYAKMHNIVVDSSVYLWLFSNVSAIYQGISIGNLDE